MQDSYRLKYKNSLHFWFLDAQQAEVDDVVININRPREVATNNDITSHVSDGKAVSEACRIQVKITGMSCSSCVNKIESSLSSKRGKTQLFVFSVMYIAIQLRIQSSCDVKICCIYIESCSELGSGLYKFLGHREKLHSIK